MFSSDSKALSLVRVSQVASQAVFRVSSVSLKKGNNI